MAIPDEVFDLVSKVSNGNGNMEDYERICLILSNLTTTELSSVFQKCDILKALMSIDLHDKQSAQIAIKLASIVFSLIPLFDFVQSHQEELLLILESTKLDLIEFILKRFAVHLVSKQPGVFKDVENSGLFQPILDGLNSRDPLVRLNWLELGKLLTVSETGYHFLNRQGVFSRLLDDLYSSASDPLGDLLLPGYIGFFGSLAKRDPDHWLGSKSDGRFKNVLSDAVDNNAISISMVAFESISCIATTPTGRITLDKLFAKGGSFDSVLNKLFVFISNSPTEICTRAVECYSFLLRRPDGIDSEGLFADAVLSLNWAIISCQKSIDTTNSNSVEDKELLIAPLLKRLYSLATQPFFEVRVAVFKAIDAIVTQPWGVRQITRQPGFFEYLLNRQTELGFPDKIQLVQAKLDIMNNMLKTYKVWSCSECKSFQNLIDRQQLKLIQLYIKEGLWGVVKSEAAVALEPG
uniref:26S proteasome non-ATPase regulatory subunit 5 n=1 Tax=Schistosoma haematobium TaxID=6185 RepID=A0A095B2L1_SCHHA